MQLSPFRQGYAFQHKVKDHFLELGFVTQEEHPATRTDICLTHSPLEIAVECKHVEEGVTVDHVRTFDERLRTWQRMERPCLGVMVATSFQEEAERLCEERNILCITQRQMEDALERRRASQSVETIPVSQGVADLLRAVGGLLDGWISHLFRDPVRVDSLFLEALLAQGYAVVQRRLSDELLELDYSDEGTALFDRCRALYDLMRGFESRYTSQTQIARSIRDTLLDWTEVRCQASDRIVLLGLGLLEAGEDKIGTSALAGHILRVTSYSG
jgi:hypothetical protein